MSLPLEIANSFLPGSAKTSTAIVRVFDLGGEQSIEIAWGHDSASGIL